VGESSQCVRTDDRSEFKESVQCFRIIDQHIARRRAHQCFDSGGFANLQRLDLSDVAVRCAEVKTVMPSLAAMDVEILAILSPSIKTSTSQICPSFTRRSLVSSVWLNGIILKPWKMRNESPDQRLSLLPLRAAAGCAITALWMLETILK
jgi:hypothetical protein